MSTEVRVPVEREMDIVAARKKGRELAGACGFSSTEQTLIATAISEVARNIVTFAQRGEIILEVVERLGKRGIVVIAQDHGPGIQDTELAMRDGYSTADSLGLGLPGTRRLMDEFELASTPGSGTRVTMTKWVR